MSKEFIGNITNKEFKEGAKDGKAWKMCIFTINSDFKCSTFNADIFTAYEVGEPVKAVYEVSGKYNNLLGFEKVEESDKATIFKPAAEQGVPTVDWIAKEKRIIRQNCNARAIEAVDLLYSVDPEALKTILTSTDGGIQALIDSFSKHFENKVWGPDDK